MTPARAATLRPRLLALLKRHLASGNYSELFITLGADYRAAIAGFESVVPAGTKIIQAGGAQGVQAGQLKRWLHGGDIKTRSKLKKLRHQVKGYAFPRGCPIRLAPEQVLKTAHKALQRGAERADNYRDWYGSTSVYLITP